MRVTWRASATCLANFIPGTGPLQMTPVLRPCVESALTMPYRRLSRAVGLGLALLVAAPCVTAARPVQMRESTPVAETILHGNSAQYVIRFDGPVNHFASRLVIMQGDRIVQTLTPLRDSAVDVLYASGRVPSPGRYALHWEAVSADGDTSKGDIPFSVEP